MEIVIDRQLKGVAPCLSFGAILTPVGKRELLLLSHGLQRVRKQVLRIDSREGSPSLGR
jgi:hypothetical protein